MLTAEADSHVDPMHARKFLAAIQWANSGDSVALLRGEPGTGHGGPNVVERAVAASVDTLAFLLEQLK